MMMSSARRKVGWPLAAALAVLLLSAAAPMVAQQLTGNIYGYVADEQGGRLPGVTVTLSGVGAPRSQTTDARGEYRFVSLDPGTYTLVYELQGFSKITKPNVQVALGQNTNTSATLSLSTVEAAVTVQGESPLLDTRKVETGANVDAVELQSLPTARDPWVILQTVPGVQTDRLNVGGNESGQQTNYVGKGAAGNQNVWNIDGVTITDMGALGSSPTYYDFDSFEEMNASTGGSDVTSQTPGVQLNMVTKRGTNELHGSARVMLAQQEWQSRNIPSEAVQQGVGGGNRIDEVQDYGVEVGGPIIRDRLWLWGAYGRNQIDLLTISNTSDKTTLEDTNGKLNVQFFESLAGTASYTKGDKIKLGRNTGPTRPQPAGWNQSGPTEVIKGELSYVFSQSLFASASYSYVSGGFGLTPAGGLAVNNLFIDPNGVWQGSYLDYRTIRPQHQTAANGSYFFNTGSVGNELKFGFSYRSTPVTSFSSWPGNGNYGDLANFAEPVAVLTRQAVAGADLEFYSGYLGDTITAGNLTLNVGARYDLQRGNNVGTTTPANPVVPDLLPEIAAEDADFPFEWEDISPRVGLTYALGAQKKTLLKASYARYADQLGVAPIVFSNPGALAGIYYFWNDNGDHVITRDELDFGRGLVSFYGLDPDNPGSAISPNTQDPDLEAGQTDEIVFGIEREIIPEFVVGLNYTYRSYDGAIYPRRTGLTAADFELAGNVTGTLPNGEAYSEPYYALRPGVEVPAGLTIENRPDWEQIYHGVDLNFQKRLSNRWMMRASVGWQDWTEEAGPDSCYDPTNNRGGTNNLWPGTAIGLIGGSTCAGDDIAVSPAGAASGAKNEVFINSTWQFNVGGLYQLPLGFNIAGNLYGREGYPFIRFHRIDPGDGLGTRDVVIGKMDDERYDNVYNLDLRLEKILNLAPLQIALSADVFNVLNENTVLQRNGRVNQATFNQIREIQSPRVVRVGARLSF
jgi:hypothetical protein